MGNCCKTFKQSYEFIGYGAKDASKQFKTCNSCRQRFNKHKRFITLPDSELEIIDLGILNKGDFKEGLLFFSALLFQKNFLENLRNSLNKSY